MILAIDVGNSRIKCAVVNEDRVIGRETVATSACDDAVSLNNLVRRVSGAVLSIEKAVVSSVVPPLTAPVVKAVERHLGAKALVVSSEVRLPFRLAVARPQQVGSDRFCAAAGAVGFKRRNAIVIDAGSAITVDVVKDGEFLGGIIAAGPSIALRALHRYAIQLPKLDLDSISSPFPRSFDSTETAMTLGATVGCVGAIRESVRYLESLVGTKARKYLTGGQAGLLATRLPRSWHFDPDLTLKGLYVISSLNRRLSD